MANFSIILALPESLAEFLFIYLGPLIEGCRSFLEGPNMFISNLHIEDILSIQSIVLALKTSIFCFFFV
jgi:hypothetical protein